MEPFRRRKKKLILAFHFSRAKQAAWECEPCRKLGLQGRRRCAFIGGAEATGLRPVWVAGKAVAYRCPKSTITGESLSFCDEFIVWQTSGRPDLRDYAARTAEALLILDQELKAQNDNG